ncbi:MAG: DUF2807 domain-containing protein [Tannerella sp.]|jgi:phage shock protein PspC (stress-responsive transcriptional regulator)|nr:DUF2807 domain-containing protein [Tannerella sp.]
MKKTLNVNLNGRVFTIDEDAYNLLDNYLNSLRHCFRNDEGAAEIIADFEARIEELFGEKIRLGHQVITLEHVEEVIARVGKPGDFEGEGANSQAETDVADKGKKKFYRNMNDKMLGGVCSGIAAYFGWSVIAVRIIVLVAPFVLSSLINWHIVMPLVSSLPGMWILAYFILWMIVPAAQTVEQKLQMVGKPITAENIGKTVAAESAPPAPKQQKGCLAGLLDLFVAFVKVTLAGLGCLIGLPILFALLIVVIVLIALALGLGGGMIGVLPAFVAVNHPVLATVTLALVIGIPVFVIIYGIIAHFAKFKPLHQSIKWGILLLWIVAAVMFFFSGFRVDGTKWFKHTPWWNESIIGNNIPSEKTFNFENDSINRLEIGEHMMASIYIEQIPDSVPSSLEIKGDENIVELVRYTVSDGRLSLTADKWIRNDNNLEIHLRTNDLSRIYAAFIGNIRIDHAYSGDVMEIIMNGVGDFRADSLYVDNLTVRTEGVGSVNIGGKTFRSTLNTSGAGGINAYEMVSDTVYAEVDGVGAIRCNPTSYLHARVNGIGSITYKEEPADKNTGTSGIGRIKRR